MMPLALVVVCIVLWIILSVVIEASLIGVAILASIIIMLAMFVYGLMLFIE